jgi:hypothetical protein
VNGRALSATRCTVLDAVGLRTRESMVLAKKNGKQKWQTSQTARARAAVHPPPPLRRE